ncbi:MAG: type II toxin-antitoxin system RelE/ParE family toxin [Chloroflexota bacterium]|nr:type II toxin-antitoxin system RelE/ParE family toxin [Chloroflexota bacterium]MDE2936239.1 type II toxin-antitoxin system RelE/ParE family toxin [Chloroflexota bacterium]
MEWEVEFTYEFESWWNGLSESQQESVAARVELLIEHGPQLPFPHSSNVVSSRYGGMRELRIQSGGRPYRVFYAFDPRRIAILLTGGDKTGDDRFYARFVPKADSLFEEHLNELRKDGLIE